MEIESIQLHYDEVRNLFAIIVNEKYDLLFTSSQFVDFLTKSMYAVNSVIANRFDKSMHDFLESKQIVPSSLEEKDGEKAINEVERWLKGDA